MNKKTSSPGTISGHTCLLLFSRKKGSMTIEAAILLPLLISLFFLWIRFFEVIDFQLELQHAMQDTAVQVASAAYYLEDGMEDESWQLFLTVGLSGMTLDKMEEGYWENSLIRKGRNGMNCFLHEFRDGVEMLFHYKIRIPLIPKEICLPVRQIAYQKSYQGESVHRDENAEYVYVTESGDSFHVQRNCPSIKRSIRYCLIEELAKERNKNGSIYYSCEVCGEERTEGYYITDHGTRYHTSLNCPNIKRKVFLIRKDCIGERSACKTCGEGWI